MSEIRSKASTQEYRDGWDRTFGDYGEEPALCSDCGGYGKTLETRVTLDDSRFVWVSCPRCGGIREQGSAP